MEQKKVINAKNKSVPLPVVGSIAWYLLLDKFNAPGWLWGALGFAFTIVWVAAIVDIFNREELPPLA